MINKEVGKRRGFLPFIVNHHYFETNTAFSLHTGKEFLNDDLILMNADVVYPKRLLTKLINSKVYNCLVQYQKNFKG